MIGVAENEPAACLRAAEGVCDVLIEGVDEAVKSLGGRRLHVPAQAEVEGDAAVELEIILDIEAEELVLVGGLRVEVGAAAGGVAHEESGDGVAGCSVAALRVALRKGLVESEMAVLLAVVDIAEARLAEARAELDEVAIVGAGDVHHGGVNLARREGAGVVAADSDVVGEGDQRKADAGRGAAGSFVAKSASRRTARWNPGGCPERSGPRRGAR